MYNILHLHLIHKDYVHKFVILNKQINMDIQSVLDPVDYIRTVYAHKPLYDDQNTHCQSKQPHEVSVSKVIFHCSYFFLPINLITEPVPLW